MKILINGRYGPFVEGDSLDYSVPLAWTVDDVIDQTFCLSLRKRIDDMNPEVAPITTASAPVMNTRVRNNERVMFDDVELAANLYQRLLPAIPMQIANMNRHSNNERFRGYRYQPGQRFAPHFDGSFARNEHEVSLVTLLVYLNDDFSGGSTNFCHHDVAVIPKAGRACLFQHHLLHEGVSLIAGTKYVLRTDVMYCRELDVAVNFGLSS
jgi:prolyl 4-hydroxylase